MLGSRPVIRIIRLLGAALGLLVGLTFVTGNGGPFSDSTYAGALIAAWLVAWLVVGFAVLPYLTIVPAGWLIRGVQELATAEFVTAVVGLLLGLVMGLLLGLPLAAVPAPLGTWLPLGISIFLTELCPAWAARPIAIAIELLEMHLDERRVAAIEAINAD